MYLPEGLHCSVWRVVYDTETLKGNEGSKKQEMDTQVILSDDGQRRG